MLPDSVQKYTRLLAKIKPVVPAARGPCPRQSNPDPQSTPPDRRLRRSLRAGLAPFCSSCPRGSCCTPAPRNRQS